LKLKHFKAYPDYCGHCDVLYRRVLEPLGYDVYLDMSGCDRATCHFYVLRKGSNAPAKKSGKKSSKKHLLYDRAKIELHYLGRSQ
jgi:hypothetical protein